MTKKKSLFLALGVLLGTAIVGYVVPRLSAPHRIDQTSAGLIERGMTEANVKAILGPPQYDSRIPSEKTKQLLIERRLLADRDELIQTWSGDKFELNVVFDEAEKVKVMYLCFYEPEMESLVARFRRWLGL